MEIVNPRDTLDIPTIEELNNLVDHIKEIEEDYRKKSKETLEG